MQPKYDHNLVEKDKNQKWIKNKYFAKHNFTKKVFSMILPPPNITGVLHLGHAWNGYIQDTILRYKKLNGYDVLWIPAIDHAGIATQIKVEKHLKEKENLTRLELGRDKFLSHVWDWQRLHTQKIVEQWHQLGFAFDYDFQKFTMDSNLSQIVVEAFINLYQKKLIYRGKRAINWDVKLQTVVSNIEVENKLATSKMYYLNYALSNQKDQFVLVASTRPETIFSDVALAVNPKDKNHKNLIGNFVINPLTNAIMPIIESDKVEIEKGSGIMKVSAHSLIDIEIINQNNLPLIESIDKDGKMNGNARDLQGVERFKAREIIAKRLEKSKHLVKIETINNYVSYSQRSGSIIEILVQPQWFLKVKPLIDKLLDDLNSPQGVTIYPLRFKNKLIEWVQNAYDWTISRQLWWGHRIPAWYLSDQVKVQKESPGPGWVQDEDVLDTWFSSGLSPFSFLNWPNSPQFKLYYPTSLLVTGYDIIFFWVARMYFLGLELTDQKPFNEVLFNGLIRDQNGVKMSKSKDNGIDPLKVIEKYGRDALRWFLLTNSSPGQDIRFSETKLEAAWNLCNKIWNIGRFIAQIMPKTKQKKPFDTDYWILNKLAELEKEITIKIKNYQFTLIGKKIVDFVEEDFSSWYLQFSKVYPNFKVAKFVLEQFCIMVHPFLPFLSDEIYHRLTNQELLIQNWPIFKNKIKKIYIDKVIMITKALRQFRNKYNISHKQVLEYYLPKKLSKEETQMINYLVNGQVLENKGALVIVNQYKIYVKISDELLRQEKTRIIGVIDHLKSEIKRAEKILNNHQFIKNAPSQKIEFEKDKLVKLKKALIDLKQNKKEL